MGSNGLQWAPMISNIRVSSAQSLFLIYDSNELQLAQMASTICAKSFKSRQTDGDADIIHLNPYYSYLNSCSCCFSFTPLKFIGVLWSPLESIGVHWSPLESIGVHWSWGFEMILTLLSIGVHWSTLELNILYDNWWSPLELMELVEFLPKKDLH